MPAATPPGAMSRYSATTAAVALPQIGHRKHAAASPTSAKQLLPATQLASDPSAFLSTLHAHVQHAHSVHASLHHHTTSTLATLTQHLTAQQTARTQQRLSQQQQSRLAIREAEADDREWRVRSQERAVMEANVRQRRQERERRERERRDEEDERDRRIYQQQQHIFQLHIERLAEQAEAEQTREAEEQAEQQRLQVALQAQQQDALTEKRRQWTKLTGKAEVEQQWLDEWIALTASPDQQPISLDPTSGDRLNVAIATTTPTPALASLPAGQPQLTANSPRPPLPSPSAKKGKKDEAAPPMPPPPSLGALLASHPTAFSTHSECHSLASAFHSTPPVLPAVATFLSSSHDTLLPALLRHIHRTAAGPPLPCLPLHLPAFRSVISVVGAPYTGKHSQALRLAQRLNLHVVDMYATLASPDPPAAVAERLLAGTPLDDELLVRLACDEMRRVDAEACDGVLLLDFPATLNQAHLLCSYLTGVLPVETDAQAVTRSRLVTPAIDAVPVALPAIPAGGGLTAVIELRCEARTRRSRCVGRCVDADGVEWHRENNEMEREQLGKEALTQLDYGATLEKEAREWERQRGALTGWWTQCGNKLDVDGEGSRDDVYARLSASLDALLARPAAEAAAVDPSPFEPLLDLQLARTLSTHVRRYQAEYVAASELYVRSMRGLRLSAEELNATVRECVTRLLRSDSGVLDVWREEEEREEADAAGLDADEAAARRHDGGEKDEQHLRVDDMAARMSALLAARHAQWRAELSATAADGWVERLKRRLTAASVRQLQAEVDRWVGEARVVRDYEAGRGAVLAEDDRGERVYELLWPKGRAAEEKKEDKAAAGKPDKAKGKAAAVVDEVKTDVDAWTDMRQQITRLLWQPTDDGSSEQAKQLMAAAEAALWRRVEQVELSAKAALEGLDADVQRLMAQLDELSARRAAAEEEQVRALCRYARRRIEAEEERCGAWLVRRQEAGEVALLVDGGCRMRSARRQVTTSIWAKEGSTRPKLAQVEIDQSPQTEKVGLEQEVVPQLDAVEAPGQM